MPLSQRLSHCHAGEKTFVDVSDDGSLPISSTPNYSVHERRHRLCLDLSPSSGQKTLRACRSRAETGSCYTKL